MLDVAGRPNTRDYGKALEALMLPHTYFRRRANGITFEIAHDNETDFFAAHFLSGGGCCVLKFRRSMQAHPKNEHVYPSSSWSTSYLSPKTRKEVE